jgi:hypothetical protein
MKTKITKLSNRLFKSKIEIEKELEQGNKTNENLYSLIMKAIEFLKSGRTGAPISKRLPIFRYFEKEYGVSNLFLIDISKQARAFYTNTSQNEFEILQIILEVHETHKEYERKGGYT